MGSAPTRRDAVLTAYSKSLIHFKARQLCRKPGFSRSDEDDLAQELTLRLLRKAHLYDPGRASLNTFADRVINSEVKMILRERHALKRAPGFTSRSLDADITDSDGAPNSLGNTVSEGDQARRTGSAETNPLDALVTADAIAEALRSLPPFIADVANHLQQGNVATVARELGVPRARVHAAMKVIREHLERAGFGNTKSTRTP